MFMPSTKDKFVVIAINSKGEKYPIAYSKSHEEAKRKGVEAKRIIELSGGTVNVFVELTNTWMNSMEEKSKLHDKAKKIVEEWCNKQEHNRCWHYPELFNNLAEVFDVCNFNPKRVSREEFESGCDRFVEEEYGKKDPTVVDFRVSLGLEFRKDVKTDEEFVEKCKKAIEHMLQYNIAAALTAADIAHDVMPDYNKTKVRAYGKKHQLPTVPSV